MGETNQGAETKESTVHTEPNEFYKLIMACQCPVPVIMMCAVYRRQINLLLGLPLNQSLHMLHFG